MDPSASPQASPRKSHLFRKIVSAHEFDALGEQFETNEHKHFGADGLDLYRDKVAALEKQLGIYDLAQFTPSLGLLRHSDGHDCRFFWSRAHVRLPGCEARKSEDRS